jgi:multiple sugar transport system substrate-binding protein
MTHGTISPSRTLTLSAGLLVAGLTLGGCAAGGGGGADGGEVSGSITLQTWSLTPTFTDYLDDAIAAFEEEYPDASVELVDQPGEGYAEKVLSQASTDSLPDVINLPPEMAYPLAQRGILADVSESDDAVEDEYVPGALDAYRFDDGGVFAYPWYLNTDINYWNASQLDSCGLDSTNPPATVDDLFQQAAVMAQSCPDTYLMSRKPTLDDFARSGVEVMSEDGSEFTFADNEEAVALIDRYADAYQQGLMPSSVLNSDYLGNSTLFTQGRVAWTTGGATALDNFETDNPSLVGNIVVNPALDTPPLYVQGLAVSAQSENLTTALAFARFLANAENQEEFAHLANVFPSTVSSQSDPYFSEDDGTLAAQARILANEALNVAENLTPVQVNDAMKTILDQQIALALQGSVSSADALAEAQSRMNDLLADS